jgi:hypothetical protein
MNEQLYHDVMGALHRSAQLEQRAAAGDANALRQKAAHDLALLGQIKEAGWAELAPAVKKGLVGGAAAAVPLTAGGAYLIHDANQKAEDFRNKALLGTAGVGAGLLALHHGLSHVGQKTAADTAPLLMKLATVSYLDDVFAAEEAKAPNDDVHALRLLNAEHGSAILRELLNS